MTHVLARERERGVAGKAHHRHPYPVGQEETMSAVMRREVVGGPCEYIITYKEGEGLLELRHLLFGQRVGLR